MPVVEAKREGACRTCGGRIRKGEYMHYTTALGPAHVEPACSQGTGGHRPNKRAGTCSCGAVVAAGKGTLRLLEDRGPGKGKRWVVNCARCARPSLPPLLR